MGHLLYIRQLMSHLIFSCLYLPVPLPLMASPFPAFSRSSFGEDNKHLLSTSCVPHDLPVLPPLYASSPLPVLLEVTSTFWPAGFTGFLCNQPPSLTFLSPCLCLHFPFPFALSTPLGNQCAFIECFLGTHSLTYTHSLLISSPGPLLFSGFSTLLCPVCSLLGEEIGMY